MSYLTYNSVKLQVESFQRFDQTAIYSDDGTDYLYTEITIVSRSLWHPVTNSLMGGVAPDTTAAVTMDALRKTLLTPRAQLIIQAPSAGFGENDGVVGKVFLKSPLANPTGGAYATDAKVGPQPLFCNIQQIIGEETMIVDFGIVTWINECPGSAGNPISPILSHRWSQAHFIDEMQHTKRVVAGTAVLRSDLLYNSTGQLIIRADDFRDYIFHNIPPNYRRVDVNVEATSDGTRLQYVITDQEVDGVLDPAIHSVTEVAEIEGTYSEMTDAAPVPPIGSAVSNSAIAAAGSVSAGPVGAGVAAFLAGAGTLVAGSFPKKTFEVYVRVQGTRRSTRTGLVIVAIRAAAGFRIGTLGQPNAASPTETLIRALAELYIVSNFIQVGLVEKYAVLRLTYTTGGISSALHQLIGRLVPGTVQPSPPRPVWPSVGGFGPSGPRPNTPATQTQIFQAGTDTPNVPLPIPILDPSDPTGVNPLFPNQLVGVTKAIGTATDSYGPRGGTLVYGHSPGSRGSAIAHLVTQALSLPCTAPPAPAVANKNYNSLPTNVARRTIP